MIAGRGAHGGGETDRLSARSVDGESPPILPLLVGREIRTVPGSCLCWGLFFHEDVVAKRHTLERDSFTAEL